jgi:hypothetical protein
VRISKYGENESFGYSVGDGLRPYSVTLNQIRIDMDWVPISVVIQAHEKFIPVIFPIRLYPVRILAQRIGFF